MFFLGILSLLRHFSEDIPKGGFKGMLVNVVTMKMNKTRP